MRTATIPTRLLIAVVVLLNTACATTEIANWQYAGNTGGKDDKATFYDAASMERLSGDFVRVWIISIPEKTIVEFFNKQSKNPNKQLIKHARQRSQSDSIPQFFLIPSVSKYYAENYDKKGIHDIEGSVIIKEVAVNDGSIPIKKRTYLQFDCSGKRVAVLYGMTFDAAGHLKSAASGEPPKYELIPPVSVAYWLSQLVCLSPEQAK